MSFVRACCLAGAAALAMLAYGAGASADTLTPLAPYSGPNAVDTTVLGINNAGWTTGSVDFADGATDGFIRDPSGAYTLFSLDSYTEGRAISNGETVVGYSYPVTGSGSRSTWSEFTYAAGGASTTLTNPATGQPLHGIAQGINDSGAVVGDYVSSTAPMVLHGFVLNGSSLTDIVVPGSGGTLARGIASNGTVVGWYTTTDNTVGFVRAPDGTITSVSDPNSVYGTVLEGVNNNGVAIGTWTDAANNSHGFLYNIATQSITELNIPNATSVQTFGINDAGKFVVSSDVGDFIYAPGGPSAPDGSAVYMPLQGVSLPAGESQFEINVQPGETYYVDPASASGFEYLAGTGPDFTGVNVSETGTFQLWLENSSGQWVFDTDITGGTPYAFGSPVGAFEIRGTPSNPSGWVTGLSFAGPGEFNGYEVAVVPEPATWAMLILGLALIGVIARRDREGLAAAA